MSTEDATPGDLTSLAIHMKLHLNEAGTDKIALNWGEGFFLWEPTVSTPGKYYGVNASWIAAGCVSVLKVLKFLDMITKNTFKKMKKNFTKERVNWWTPYQKLFPCPIWKKTLYNFHQQTQIKVCLRALIRPELIPSRWQFPRVIMSQWGSQHGLLLLALFIDPTS